MIQCLAKNCAKGVIAQYRNEMMRHGAAAAPDPDN